MEQLEKDQKKLKKLMERICECDDKLASLDNKIDTHVESMLATESPKTLTQARATLETLHAEEQELADDLAKRRAAALILRQRLRIALFELKPQAASQDSQQKLCEVFLSTSIARSMPPKKTYESQGKQLGADADELSGAAAGGWELKTDDYTVDRKAKLGSGAFGDVFRGTCRGQTVAIKELTAEFDESLIEAFRGEVAMLANLRHPNVVLFMGASAQLGNLAIVSEFLPRGSVYDLLRDKKTALSLKRRLLFATDCARGMVWLHGASPPILHLDLKTANLLVNEAWSVKVGDFGLARHKRVALAGRVGSPLYMAPEVLQGEAYDESADVYSFGVILCELHTRADPYDGAFADYLDLVNAVVNRKQRPTLPKDVDPAVAALAKRCWAATAADRPSFAEIVASTTIDDAIIDSIISESNALARKMWKGKFRDRHAVPWSDFVRQLTSTLGVDPDTLSTDSLRGQSFRQLLGVPLDVARDATAEATVSIEAFGRMLEWFGPLSKGETLFETIDSVLRLEGFYGDVSTAAAEAALKADGKKGTYLIRFSSTPGSYAITLINKKGVHEHYRITHTPGKPYVMARSSFASLEELLKKTKDDLSLKRPLANGPFEKLYRSHQAKYQRSEGYVAVLE